ncbi:valine--tRNA ligase [Candidatus Wolfebacteria bacterium]|nr:valine--tRNA ligase [Candidatus Wolfebacteria bacterium]
MKPRYDHKSVESKIYDLWEKSGYFNPDNLPVSKNSTLPPIPFCIIMPPPNANGSLHIGHALFVTLEDIMIRFKRMQGYKTLWLPGADHAGFETQVVFEKKLEKEGRNRFEIPREKLYEEMYDFTQKSKAVMYGQLKKLGASCDWSREKFTLEPDIVRKVQETFVQMHNDGFIYRGNQIINWCVKHQTTLSDLEVEYEERSDPLYFIKYGPFTLATVRPETKFGDTAVAVNPNDERYKEYIGKDIEIETLLGPAKIKVIADDVVDPEFGTGVVKVTPAHDPVDFEIGQRHDLEVREVIGKDGRLNEKAGPYAGMKIAEARKKVAEDMKKRGLLIRVNPTYTHNVAVCFKCRNVIEPLVMPQWFVKMKEATSGRPSLKDIGTEPVKTGLITFVPDRFHHIYYQWMENLRDWALSRQIVWGIRIPAWQCRACNEWIVSMEKPSACLRCTGSEIEQDPDVLDTWFSSGQWPYLALGYPDAIDYKTFYPTSVMETGWDIIFKWVSRMIVFGMYKTGKIPFRTVYLHGLVLDKDRQKMSKSKGNVIDPLGVAEVYGTDAVRMALIVGNAPGSNSTISEDKIRGYRNFATKIWNAARFVLSNYDKKLTDMAPQYTDDDQRILLELQEIHQKITIDLESFRFHHAAETAYHYFWHTFADKIIEESKPRLKSENLADRATALALNLKILNTSLIFLHPFMPFITEEVYQRLPNKTAELLMIEGWQA